MSKAMETTMKKMSWIVLAFVASLSMLTLSTSAAASSEVERYHEISIADIQHVVLKNGVGSVYVEQGEGSNLTIRAQFEGKRSGIMRRTKDVSDMDINIRERNGVLTLSFSEDNVEATWRVTLPRVDKLDIDLGVGLVDVNIGATAVNIDLGVGDVKVVGLLSEAGAVSADVGVGAVSIDGAHDVSSKRAIVAETARGRGDGEYPINIDIGVGDAGIRLR
ncbi:hypothetical protein CWE08_06700 [Aliidiomarina iranensis]|uniref:Adhesin domain-containing protein n=1 Tax=Aliidiomarina iranensis TaxID=1434071 RepID=A0A432VX20_9GAMM|nr:hypothetical protein [Aliidiomarina iranensis]RUO21263.1 hypothetical protein CWE08_06700 [Aliidiomarina iranensis]